jgi:hypothetical protein
MFHYSWEYIRPGLLGAGVDPVVRGNAVLIRVENESIIIKLTLEAS